MSLALAIVAASEHELEGVLTAAWVGYSSWRLATFSGEADLLVSSAAYWVAALFAIFRTNGSGELWRFLGGIGMVFVGLVVKMMDTTGKRPWGTAAFHYATALGWTMFWSWSQTLPRR